MLAKVASQRRYPLSRNFRLIADEKPNQLGRDKLSGCRLLENNLEAIIAIEWARLSENLLDARVMLIWIELKDAVLYFPARKAAGQFLDVFLGVISRPQTEQLHH